MADADLEQGRLETLFALADGDQVPPTPLVAPTIPTSRCPAALGRDHDFTMKGRDGVRRCWYCCRTKEAV